MPLLWFLVTDPVKLLAYKVLDAVKADTAPQAEAGLKPGADAEPPPEPEVAPETDEEASAERLNPKPRSNQSLRLDAIESQIRAGRRRSTQSPSPTSNLRRTPTVSRHCGKRRSATSSCGRVKDPEDDPGRIFAGWAHHPRRRGIAARRRTVEAEASTGAKAGPKAEPKPEAKITALSASTSRVPT